MQDTFTAEEMRLIRAERARRQREYNARRSKSERRTKQMLYDLHSAQRRQAAEAKAEQEGKAV